MTQQEYDAAIIEGPVAYHEAFCEKVSSLGYFPCNCGAVEQFHKMLAARAVGIRREFRR